MRLCLLLLAGLSAAVVQTTNAAIRVDADAIFRDVEILAADDMEGRLTGTDGNRRARAYIVSRFESIGVARVGAGFEQPFRFTPRRGDAQTGTNVVGVIRGTRNPDRYVVVTAHYDHLGTRSGVVFNGADDNASGVAALLALATWFTRHRPEHSILLAALDAEESGLRGAMALLADPPVPVSAMVLTVNLDMVGRDADNRLFAAGLHHAPFLRPYLEQVAQPPVQLVFGHDTPDSRDDWTEDSDHYPFHRAGIPFVYFGVEDAQQQHQPTDDAATIGREFLAGAAGTVIAAVRRIDAGLDEIAAQRATAR